MIVVTGFGVIDFTLSSSAWPQPASLVSTSVTPASVMNTDTLPPLNARAASGSTLVITKRLSLQLDDVELRRGRRRRRRLRRRLIRRERRAERDDRSSE